MKGLARHGASTPILELIATFLTDRVMMVKVGSLLSTPRRVNGGSPQGSILGVFLLNATIDDLEEDCPELPETRRSIQTSTAAIPSTLHGVSVEMAAPDKSPTVKEKEDSIIQKNCMRPILLNEIIGLRPYGRRRWPYSSALYR